CQTNGNRWRGATAPDISNNAFNAPSIGNTSILAIRSASEPNSRSSLAVGDSGVTVLRNRRVFSS
ncbi:hypothetical protein, partial [Stutzerimonas balearica]|uniref:hypothetical protein n=1 Tax=Stutzerimonas balearica TaxID=74829 RepID=UPI00289FE63C